MKKKKQNNYGIYIGVEGKEPIVLMDYMKSNKNNKSVIIGNLGKGKNFYNKVPRELIKDDENENC